MSEKVRVQKFLRREVRRTTTELGRQMMTNTLRLPLKERFRIALIILFKKEM
jgi:hypothetical protein